MKSLWKWGALAVAFLLTALQDGLGAERLRVVTSFFPIYSFAKQVGGDYADVQNLLPANVGPHEYQATHSDLLKLSRARLILINGLGLESWMEKLLKAAGSDSDARIVQVSDAIARTNLISARAHEQGSAHSTGFDPHVWLDPQLASLCVGRIAEEFKKADPSHAREFESNAQAYRARLAELDQEFESRLRPLSGRPLVTFHNSFAYLVRRYRLNLAGVVEQVPDMEPNARELHQLLDRMRRDQVRVLFTEPQFSSKLARQISGDLKIRLAALDPLETGALEAAGYERAMRRNLETLIRELR